MLSKKDESVSTYYSSFQSRIIQFNSKEYISNENRLIASIFQENILINYISYFTDYFGFLFGCYCHGRTRAPIGLWISRRCCQLCPCRMHTLNWGNWNPILRTHCRNHLQHRWCCQRRNHLREEVCNSFFTKSNFYSFCHFWASINPFQNTVIHRFDSILQSFTCHDLFW